MPDLVQVTCCLHQSEEGKGGHTTWCGVSLLGCCRLLDLECMHQETVEMNKWPNWECVN